MAAVRGSAQPLPLALARDALPRSVLVWSGAAALLAVALFGLASLGFGRLESGFALQPNWLLVLYAALGAGSAFCIRRVLTVLAGRRALPYMQGVYLFPSGVIDTRNPEFVVRSLREATNVVAKERTLLLEFEDKSRFSFKVGDRKRADELKQAIAGYRQQLDGSTAPPSMRELALLDPLCDNGFKNPFSPTESMRPGPPKRLPLGLLLAIPAGALVGLAIFGVRNSLAEDALYRAARLADTREAYVAYAERGGERPEVREILLPRTELSEVVKRDSLEELEQFWQAHKNSKIAQEADIALQHKLRAALDEARRRGTLTALKEFKAKHGAHPSITAQVDRAIEEHWRARLAAFEKSARPRPEVTAFFERLLTYAVKNGNQVEIRFRRRLPESVDRAENMIRKSITFGGSASLPKQYFDARHAAAREEGVGKELHAVLSRAFPKDLLDFQLAEPLPDSPDELPKVSVPTLLITHRTEMSGGYLLKSPRAALTGIGVLFRVAFQIPGDAEPLQFKLSTWNAPELNPSQFKSFEATYEEMAARAFTKFPQKYLEYVLPGLSG